MPFNSQQIYSKPAGTTAAPNTTIESAKFNEVIDDLVNAINYQRPGYLVGFGEAVWKATKALLDADLAHAADMAGVVYADSTAANNGVYVKTGAYGLGSWTRKTDLPYSFIPCVDSGAGTANAIQLIANLTPPTTAGTALFLANVFEANTGAVTVSINGATAKALKTKTGNALASDYLATNDQIMFVDNGTDYRLTTDVVSATIVTAAEAAAAAAEDARDAAEDARDAAEAAAAAAAAAAAESSISYTAQSLTSAQKAQARDNIDATSIITSTQLGAAGVNDTAAIGTALTNDKLVLVNNPTVINTGISPGDGTIFLPAPALLTGTVTLAEAQALMFKRGFIGGIPMANNLRDKRVGIIAGTMRQNAAIPTQWDYINDAAHEPIGVSGTYATAVGSQITLTYDRTYTQVGSFICGPDETLANSINFSCGASAGISSAVIKASIDRTLAITAQYNGSRWVTSYVTGQGGGGILPNLVSVSHLGANVTIEHSYIPGIDVTITPWSVGGAYIPKPFNIKSISNTKTVVNFINPASWTFDTTADTSWAFTYQKRFTGGIVLDTTDYALDTGNLWFMGIHVID